MSKKAEAVKRRRKATKNLIIECMGGQCQVCAYSRCVKALELHHVEPGEKEYSISQMLTRSRGWNTLYTELEKCILLCSNCHRELHSGVIQLPTVYVRFSRTKADALRTPRSLPPKGRVTEAQRRENARANRDKKLQNRKDLILESGIDLSQRGSITRLAELLGITTKNVRTWLRRNMPELYQVRNTVL